MAPAANAYISRRLVANIESLSDTLDIDVNILNLLDLLVWIEGEASTEDVQAHMLRELVFSTHGLSGTQAFDTRMIRNLVASAQGASLSPDDISIILTGLGSITYPGLRSLSRRKNISSM
jgi:hypothetical protein